MKPVASQSLLFQGGSEGPEPSQPELPTFVTFCSNPKWKQKATKGTKVQQRAGFLTRQVLSRVAVSHRVEGLATSCVGDSSIPTRSNYNRRNTTGIQSSASRNPKRR